MSSPVTAGTDGFVAPVLEGSVLAVSGYLALDKAEAFLVFLALLLVFVALGALLEKVVPQAQRQKFDRWLAKFDKWLSARRQRYFRWRNRRAKLEEQRSPPSSGQDVLPAGASRLHHSPGRLPEPAIPPDWPETEWKLTAPECFQLWFVGHGDYHATVRLAVSELVASGALRVKPVGLRTGSKGGPALAALVEGPYAGTGAGSPLHPVLELFACADKRTLPAVDSAVTPSFEGVLLWDFVRAARRELRPAYHDQIFAGLAERGLVDWGATKAWTDAGRDAADELDEWLQVGRERLGRWASKEPRLAFAYTGGAGATILLMDDRDPEFALLRQYLGANPGGPSRLTASP